MRTVGVRELKQHASQILDEVQEKGEEVQVTRRGRVIARLVPVSAAPVDARELETVWSDMDRLAEEIGRYWPEKVSAAQAVGEGRREL